jgi:hypothetical protein
MHTTNIPPLQTIVPCAIQKPALLDSDLSASTGSNGAPSVMFDVRAT